MKPSVISEKQIIPKEFYREILIATLLDLNSHQLFTFMSSSVYSLSHMTKIRNPLYLIGCTESHVT